MTARGETHGGSGAACTSSVAVLVRTGTTLCALLDGGAVVLGAFLRVLVQPLDGEHWGAVVR